MKARKKQITAAAMAATLTLAASPTVPTVSVFAQENQNTQKEMQIEAEGVSTDNVKDTSSVGAEGTEDAKNEDSRKDAVKEKDKSAASSAGTEKSSKKKTAEASQKKAVKNSQKKAEKSQSKKQEKSTEKKAAKSTEKKAAKSTKKTAVKSTEKKAVKSTEKKAASQPQKETVKSDAVIINEKNFPDKSFRSYISEKFDTDKNGSLSQEELQAVTKIDISGHPDSFASLKGIEHFTALTDLDCSKTGVKGLDVSKNTSLRRLSCAGTKLAWMNTGKNKGLTDKKIEAQVNLTADSTSFNIKQEFEGIDVSKISHMSGATLTKETVSGYTFDTPVTYEYDCSDSEEEKAVLKVTLNLMEGSETDAAAESGTEASKEKPSYTVPANLTARYGQTLSDIELPEGFSWQDVGTTSVGNIGSNSFKVTYTPEDTDAYETVENIDVHIAVSPAETNSWTKELSVTGWTYGKYDKTKNAPSAVAKSGGTVTYTYASSEDGMYTASVPKNAGTWYVKAAVAETNEYTGLESAPVAFIIAKAAASYKVPSGLTATYGQKLKNVTLPSGFSWNSASKSVGKVGKKTFKATYTPTDTANYEVKKDIDVTVTVEKAKNKWTTKLSIKDWTYGDEASTPKRSSTFGDAAFTYSDKEDGTYTSEVPKNAGTWYVKATVKATDNYTGLKSSPVSFKIAPKDGTKLTIPTITQSTDLTKLSIKDGDTTLVSGTDYTATKKQSGTTVTVTVAYKGNYTGTVTRTYSTTSGSTGRTSTTTAPRTGDTADMGLWSSGLLASGGILAYLARKKRKEAEE